MAKCNMGGAGITCPYYRREKDKKGVNKSDVGYLYCEMARFDFPDKKSRRNLIYKYCCNNGESKDGSKCTVKEILDIYYETVS